MNVLLINGHPRNESLTDALAASYIEGAAKANVNLQYIVVRDLQFNPNVTHQHTHDQPMEADILSSQEKIRWADHLVFVYPTWWGTMPALLKGFIDRVFTAGFAFLEIDGGTGYEGLLKGKTAQLITTMDTPNFVYNLLYRAPGHNAMKRATLGFCGLRMTRTLRFGPVRNSIYEKRKTWLERVYEEGTKLGNGALSPLKKLSIPVMNWLKAIRLQFYPMSFIAYAGGAYGAQAAGLGFDPFIFWLGYAWLFLIEVATVLSNDYFDFGSDKRNRYFSPFTGGSRVLVESLLDFRQVRTGILVTLGISMVVLVLLFTFTSIGAVNMIAVCGTLFILALGYTIPPVKLSYRGLGELTVGVTHSFAVILCGYMFQGGNLSDNFSWLLGLPLFLAVLPSIILAGVPDHDADEAVAKRTMAVRFGKKGAARIALAFTISATLAVIFFHYYGILPHAFAGILIPVIPHALLLAYLIIQYIRKKDPPKRIDGLLVAALTFIFWFGIVPLVNLA